MNFEDHRTHLRGVACRMLGSLAEADDAVQETWLRFQCAEVDDVRSWCTTVIARVCLDQLRIRKSRGEEELATHEPEPRPPAGEEEALLADSIGLALMVVLETLEPAERLAFVLHDVFGMSNEISGAQLAASTAVKLSKGAKAARVAFIDGVPGLIVAPAGRLMLVLRLTFAGTKVSAIEVIYDRAKLAAMEFAV